MLVLFSIYFITKWVLILIWKLGPKAWGFRTGLGVCHGAWLPGSTPIVVSSPHHRVTVVSPHLVRLKRSQTRWCRRLGGWTMGRNPAVSHGCRECHHWPVVEQPLSPGMGWM